ncbi:MAG TPA: hypothetical protein HA224_03865 [Nanoarchaeota archaeon]|nr:hypothetical protein [Nanoarchaeota archaeon]
MVVTYALREVSDFDYNSFADVGWWEFTNDIRSPMSCSKQDGRKFPRGTTVCCILDGDAEGSRLVAMVKIKSISPDGTLTFGEKIGNKWNFPLPGRSDTIIDERANLEGRVFGATQIEMPNELPKLPDPQKDTE